jgi:hypothetical protein
MDLDTSDEEKPQSENQNLNQKQEYREPSDEAP